MGIGIIDGAVDSIDSMRKVLISARSIPHLVVTPEKAVKVVVNASIAAAVLLFANRLMLYSPGSTTTISDYITVVGLNVLISATSLVPIFVVSIVAIFTRPDDEAESAADRWLIVITFIWIMTLIVSLATALYATVSGHGDNSGPRHLANQFFAGSIPIGVFKLDLGAFVLCLFFTSIAFAILVWRTRRVSQPDTFCVPKRSCIAKHAYVFLLVVVPCAILLALTLYLQPA